MSRVSIDQHRALYLNFMGVVAACLSLCSVVTATDYYVATTGDDGSPGTIAQPFATVQRGIDVANAGDVVHVRDGVYNEIVDSVRSGSSGGGYITIKSFDGETGILDATGISVPNNDSAAIFRIDAHSYLRIEGLELRNFTTSQSNRVPMGIHLTGDSNHIEILNCEIHHIETNFTGLNNGDAHGIGVFGDSSTDMHDILIDGNIIRDCRLGSSEALVVNGNVRDFVISNNTVHDCNNIGIDAIGFEGVGPNGKDQARDGIIRDNVVYNIDARFNPAYDGDFNTGGGDPSAGGIYVDGGTRILVERNIVYNCNIGIELASEHSGKATSFIDLRDNLIYQNHIGGLFMGGYDNQRGSTEDVTVTNNTFYHNDSLNDGVGELLLQFDTERVTVKNNLFAASSQGVLISNPYTQNSNNLFDYNQYSIDGATSPEWFWKDVFYGSLEDWQAGTGNDANSQFVVDPLLAAPGSGDFRLTGTSPGLDMGDPSFIPGSGETDLDGLARIANGQVDLGAFEFQNGPPIIFSEPEDVTILGSQSVTLSVGASGAGSPSYQWYVGTAGDASVPTGTDSPDLMVTPVTSTDYWVRVTNAFGSDDSVTVTVTVIPVDPTRPETPASQADPPTTMPVNFVPEMEGRFNGLLWDKAMPEVLLGDVSNFKLKKTGVFSAKVSWEGRTIRIKGEFDEAGSAIGSASRKKGQSDLTFTLQLVETEDSGHPTQFPGAQVQGGAIRVMGEISDGSVTAELIASRSPWHKKEIPATDAEGTYTMLLPTDPGWTDDRPSGDGYGTVKIDLGGRAKVKSVLGDSTKLSVTAYLSGNDDFSIYRPLYRGKTGKIGGTLSIRGRPGVSDFDGAVAWSKLTDVKSKLYPAGFDIPAMWVLGARYEAPAKGDFALSSVIEGEDNALLYFEGGNLAPPPFGVSYVTWDNKNRLSYTAGDERISIRVNARTGYLTGTFKDKVTKLKFRFGGVAYQKQETVSGLLIGVGETGTVAIQPR